MRARYGLHCVSQIYQKVGVVKRSDISGGTLWRCGVPTVITKVLAVIAAVAIIFRLASARAERAYWLGIVTARFTGDQSMQIAARTAAHSKKLRDATELTLLTQHIQDRWLVAKRQQIRMGRHGVAGRPGTASTFNSPVSGMLWMRMYSNHKRDATGAIAVWIKRSYPFKLVP